jgi:hypothetical protein
MLTDAQGGGKQIAGLTGHMIGGLDTLQATMIQDLLLTEFKDSIDACLKPVLERLVELGYAGAIDNGAEIAEVEKVRGTLKKANKPIK